MTLQKKDVLTAIAAIHVNLAWVLLRCEDGQHLVEFCNLHNGLVTFEGAWDGDLEILLG